MGDAPFVTALSAVPLLIVVASVAGAVLAWRSRRRGVRVAAAVVLVAFGALLLLTPLGVLFSMAGAAVIALLGVVLLVAEYLRKSQA